MVGQGKDDGALRDMTATTAHGAARVRSSASTSRARARARNAGFEASPGELVTFIDDDCEPDVSC